MKVNISMDSLLVLCWEKLALALFIKNADAEIHRIDRSFFILVAWCLFSRIRNRGDNCN